MSVLIKSPSGRGNMTGNTDRPLILGRLALQAIWDVQDSLHARSVPDFGDSSHVSMVEGIATHGAWAMS